MNIFVLDLSPSKCAEYHCNKHVVKMCVEHNQILGSIAHLTKGVKKKSQISQDYVQEHFKAFPRLGPEGKAHPYGIGYANHPCTKWAMESAENYEWLCLMNAELCHEYTRRYGRKHSGEEITKWFYENRPKLPNIGMTPFAQAMPDTCKDSDPVKAYRRYYQEHKARFAKWPDGRTPYWWIPTDI